jgi:hypothetical protein
MSFKQEVTNFKVRNGNSEYTQRDMLMYLCGKIEKIEDGIGNMDGRLSRGDEDFRWIKRLGYTSFVLIGILFCLYLNLAGIPKFW